MDSETKERALAKDLVGDQIECEAVPFTFSPNTGAAGEVVKKAPMAYIPDLVPKIIQLLNENDK